MKTLGDVQVGGSSTIVKLHGEGALRRHLMDLGLIKGTPFTVVKVAIRSRSRFAAMSSRFARKRRRLSRCSNAAIAEARRAPLAHGGRDIVSRLAQLLVQCTSFFEGRVSGI